MISRTITRRLIAPALLTLSVAVCGCGEVSTDPATGGGGTGGGSTTSASGGGTSTGGAAAVARCLTDCETNATCGSDTGAYQSSNYACNGGACEYQGCKTDAECEASFGDPLFICGNDPLYLLPSCLKSCQTAADCGLDDGAYAAANYTCDGGECHYQGCKTDAECAITYPSPVFVCGQVEGFAKPLCVQACQSSADCELDTAAYAAENFACTDGACVYGGCKDDAECAISQNNPDAVCR